MNKKETSLALAMPLSLLYVAIAVHIVANGAYDLAENITHIRGRK